MTKKKVMTIEEYCLKEGKQTLLQNFMLDIDFMLNMGGAEAAILTKYNDRNHLFTLKCHVCNTVWEGSAYSYIVKELCCPTCNENSDPIKMKYASRKRGSIPLSEWCDDHDEFGHRLIDEYDDENNELTREEVFRLSYSSHVSINWKCKEHGHQWSATIHGRVLEMNKCPFCMRKKVSELNSFKTYCLSNKERGRQLQNEWIGIAEDGNKYKMSELSIGNSDIKMIWQCWKCRNTWNATIVSRINGHNCPYCAGKKVSDLNSLSAWCLSNTLQGEIIKNQWTGISEDGKHYTMDEVSFGIALKMNWQCERGHRWIDTINSRTSGKQCPYCNAACTSYPEQYLYWALKQLYPETQNRYKAFKDIDSRGIELDIYIEELNLAIEYSPTCWHKGKEERDNLKKQLCEKNIISLIQIVEDDYNEYKETFTENYICIPHLVSSNKDNYLLKTVSFILNSIGHSIEEIDIELVKKNALEYSKGKIEYEKSVEFIYPTLAAEFHPTLNAIKPSEVTPGSSLQIKFICPKCNFGSQGEWETSIGSRAYKKSGCRQCGYNWSDGKMHSRKRVVLATEGVDDLKSKHPELAKEWHLTLNDISPSEVKYASYKKRYWQCTYCSYGKNGEWIAPPSRRTTKGYETSCPRCRYSYIKEETNQPQNIKSQYRKSTTPSKPKPFKYVELSDIDKEMQSLDF